MLILILIFSLIIILICTPFTHVPPYTHLHQQVDLLEAQLSRAVVSVASSWRWRATTIQLSMTFRY